MWRSFKYRLYPTKAQAEQMQWRLDRCRELYNACLEERKEAWKHGVSVGYFEQQRALPAVKEVRPEYREIDAQVLQDVVRRLDGSFQAFFRRVKAGERPGYPRFKSRDRYDSFTFHQHGWKLTDGRLVLRAIGSLKVRWSREIQGTVKTVTIRRDADQWYVCFSCNLGEIEVPPNGKPAIGVDVGLEAFATLSDGTRIENPRHFRQATEALAQRQRRLSRRKKGSKRRAKARLLVAKAHRKIRNQRRDFHHKESRKLVDHYGLIAVEDLNIAGLSRRAKPVQAEDGTYLPNGATAKSGLNKSINDAGWGQFLQFVAYKAEEAGTRLVAVNPAGTSQTCLCGARVEKTLQDRWHHCASCGLSLPRDHVSAILILARAEPSSGAA